MPPHLHTTYYQTTKAGMMALAVVLMFWVAIYFTCIYACIIYNPVVHENQTALILAVIVVVVGGLGQAAFVLGIMFYSWRYRLVFDEHGITCRGMFSETFIDLAEVTQLQWKYLKNRCKYRIDLLTPTSKITMMLELLKKQPAHRNALICYLRETIPHEYQAGWPEFRRHIECTRQNWHIDGKNYVPVVAEDEFLVTRKHLNRSLPILIPVSIVIGGIAYYCGYQKMLARGENFVALQALLAVVWVWLPITIIGTMYLMWPKNGRIWKKSQQPLLEQMQKYGIAFIILWEASLVLMFFDHPIMKAFGLVPFIAFYVLLIAYSRATAKTRSTIDEIATDLPENDIPDVLRSVSINQKN